MATQTRSQHQDPMDAEAAADRIRDFNEQLLEAGKKSSLVGVDVYEKAAHSFADFEVKVADRAQVEWVSTLAKAHAGFTRDLADVYGKATRELLK